MSDVPKFLYAVEPDDRQFVEIGRCAGAQGSESNQLAKISPTVLKRLVALAEIGIEAKRMLNVFRVERES